MDKIRVVELFAGVGGFRIGLEGYPKKDDSKYEVVWSNQWEPSTKIQHANLVYKNRWPESNHCGDDISTVETSNIPDHDLLVGGFPCQDYSVASTLKNSKGLLGKKGVLWWQIYRILEEKGEKRPKYLILENVDRLLKSPATQRGRDFAMILKSLQNLGYSVEWQVINAAEYGMPQKRKRVFIVGYLNDTNIITSDNMKQWLTDGVLGKTFPKKLDMDTYNEHAFGGDLALISEFFNLGSKKSPFENCGILHNSKFITCKYQPDYEGSYTLLKDVLVDESQVPEEFYINDEDFERWKYLKGSKKEQRYNEKQDVWYNYTEGAMTFPDDLNKPSRTIITGEGGKTASRFKHIIKVGDRHRRLIPLELERLNMFPDNHTQLEKLSDVKRAFFMGNSLVVGIIERIGKELSKIA